MNFSVNAFFLLFCLFLSNFYFGSGRLTTQSNSDSQDSENEGRRKQNPENEKMQEENWNFDSDENSGSQTRPEIEMKQETDDLEEFLNGLSNTQENELGNKDSSELHNKHHRQFKNHSSRSNRKRHNRKLKEEIQELQSELSHVVTDLEEISEKENELEQEMEEISQLRHTKKMRSKQIKRDGSNIKHPLEITLSRNDGDTSHMDRSKTDDELDSLESVLQDLKDPDAGEMKDLQKDLGEVASKNRELRRKNKELCRLLHISLIREKDIGEQGNDDFYEELDRMSSETGETLEDQFWQVCGRSHGERKVMHSRKLNLHSNEDLEKTDETERQESHEKDTGYYGKGIRISRKAKKHRQSNKIRGTYQDKNERSRKSHDYDSKTQNSRRTLYESKQSDEDGERNSQYEVEKKIELGNDEMEAEETSSKTEDNGDDQNNRRSESSISSASENFLKEDEVDAIVVDAIYSEEEEANMTISTKDADKQKVYDHIASVDEITFCDKPSPVVIYPSDHYPVPRKYYTPQGTILHRCSKHSGCCPNEQLTCVPAKKEKVTLHFFAAVLDGSGIIVPHIEKLRFVNHTKCGCVFKHHAHLYL